MENQKLDRYVGDYDHFKEVHALQKAQIEAAYNRQQQEIAQLKDFVARNKARVATRNMAMSRQKKLDRMDVIELAAEKPKPEFRFLYGHCHRLFPAQNSQFPDNHPDEQFRCMVWSVLEDSLKE